MCKKAILTLSSNPQPLHWCIHLRETLCSRTHWLAGNPQIITAFSNFMAPSVVKKCAMVPSILHPWNERSTGHMFNICLKFPFLQSNHLVFQNEKTVQKSHTLFKWYIAWHEKINLKRGNMQEEYHWMLQNERHWDKINPTRKPNKTYLAVEIMKHWSNPSKT